MPGLAASETVRGPWISPALLLPPLRLCRSLLLLCFSQVCRYLLLFFDTAGASRARKKKDGSMKRLLYLTPALLLIPMASWAATASVAADAYLNPANPTLNFGAATTLNIGGGASALI